MATRPTQDFLWATTGLKTDPGAGKKDVGFLTAERPPARWFNYLFNLIAQWLGYLDERGDTDYIPAIMGDAPSGTNFSRSTTPGAVSITGTQSWIIPIPVALGRTIQSCKIHIVWGSTPPSTGTVAFHLRRRGQGTQTTMSTFTISAGEVAGARIIDLPAGANLPEDVQSNAAAYYVFIDNAAVVAGTPHIWETVAVEWTANPS